MYNAIGLVQENLKVSDWSKTKSRDLIHFSRILETKFNQDPFAPLKIKF